jgi:hypothetical protein
MARWGSLATRNQGPVLFTIDRSLVALGEADEGFGEVRWFQNQPPPPRHQATAAA